MKAFLLIHGPNLNMLGKRDSKYYGIFTLEQLEKKIESHAIQLGFTVKKFQSNHEGALIDWLQENTALAHGIIINPGALGHYSHALHDALTDTGLPCVEVHLSDIASREPWRRKSVIRPACLISFYGEQEKSYIKALNFLAEYLKNNTIA